MAKIHKMQGLIFTQLLYIFETNHSLPAQNVIYPELLQHIPKKDQKPQPNMYIVSMLLLIYSVI